MIVKKPADCSQEELALFKNLVLSGLQVNAHGLARRIKNCYLLGFYYDENKEWWAFLL
jgi:hypothetical protein